MMAFVIAASTFVFVTGPVTMSWYSLINHVGMGSVSQREFGELFPSSLILIKERVKGIRDGTCDSSADELSVDCLEDDCFLMEEVVKILGFILRGFNKIHQHTLVERHHLIRIFWLIEYKTSCLKISKKDMYISWWKLTIRYTLGGNRLCL